MEQIYSKNHVEIFRITPNLYFRKSDYASRGQCNGAYIVSGGNVAAVDVPTVEAAQEMRQEAEELFRLPIRSLFITHGHADHVGGLSAFIDQPVTVFCSGRLLPKIRPEKSGAAAFCAVEGRLNLLLGGLDVELFTLPAVTHSPWDMFIRLPKEKYLIAGDNAVDFSVFYCGNSDMQTWPVMLKQLAAQGDQYILPGHGDPVSVDYLYKMAAHVELVSSIGRKIVLSLSEQEKDNISAGRAASLAEDFIASGDADAQLLRQESGDAAAMQVGHIIWYYLSPQ